MSIRKCLVLGAIVALLAPVAAFGDLIAKESFEYTAGSTIVGCGSDSDLGWAGAWTSTSSSSIYNSYVLDKSGSLTTDSGNYAYLAGTTSSGSVNAYRALDNVLSGTFYISFLAVQNNAAPRTWGLGLFNGTSTEYATIGQVYNAEIGGEHDLTYSIVDTASGNLSTYNRAYSAVSTSTLQRLVVQCNISGATLSMSLYVLDPDESIMPSTPDAAISDTFGSNLVVNRIRLFDGGKGSGSDIPAISSYDELKIGTTWGDVVPVPEPSTLALLGCGLLGLLAYAWRKRK